MSRLWALHFLDSRKAAVRVHVMRASSLRLDISQYASRILADEDGRRAGFQPIRISKGMDTSFGNPTEVVFLVSQPPLDCLSALILRFPFSLHGFLASFPSYGPSIQQSLFQHGTDPGSMLNAATDEANAFFKRDIHGSLILGTIPPGTDKLLRAVPSTMCDLPGHGLISYRNQLGKNVKCRVRGGNVGLCLSCSCVCSLLLRCFFSLGWSTLHLKKTTKKTRGWNGLCS